MDTELVILVTAIVTAAVLAGAWFAWRKWRTRRLEDRFGPEYGRTVAEKGDRGEAEKDLVERQKRVEEYDLRPLDADERVEFAREWERVQSHFVDEPVGAVTDAQALVDRVMEARGYPVGDIQRQQEDVSVERPDVVVHYRKAREIALRADRDGATTEDLRLAMKHYRALFRGILESGAPAEPAERTEGEEAHVG